MGTNTAAGGRVGLVRLNKLKVFNGLDYQEWNYGGSTAVVDPANYTFEILSYHYPLPDGNEFLTEGVPPWIQVGDNGVLLGSVIADYDFTWDLNSPILNPPWASMVQNTNGLSYLRINYKVYPDGQNVAEKTFTSSFLIFTDSNPE